MKAKIIPIFLSFAVAAVTHAIPLSPVNRVELRFGEPIDALGTLDAESDSWKPLFFAILDDDSIAIPDYYKSRIALYGRDGTFIKAIPSNTAVSPRMNYFGFDAASGFVTLNDGALRAIAPDGTVRWTAPLPIGVIPASITLIDSGTLLTIDGERGQSGFVISNVPPHNAERVERRLGDGALIPFTSNGAEYCLTLADTVLLRSASSSPFKPNLPDGYRFASSRANGNSLWTRRTETNLEAALLDSRGNTVRSAIIPLDPTEPWFWMAAKLTPTIARIWIRSSAEGFIAIEEYEF